MKSAFRICAKLLTKSCRTKSLHFDLKTFTFDPVTDTDAEGGQVPGASERNIQTAMGQAFAAPRTIAFPAYQPWKSGAADFVLSDDMHRPIVPMLPDVSISERTARDGVRHPFVPTKSRHAASR